MTDPIFGIYVQWTDAGGKLSDAKVLPSQSSPQEMYDAVKAALPEGTHASVIGTKLGQVFTPFFTEHDGFDALQRLEMSIANSTVTPVLHKT